MGDSLGIYAPATFPPDATLKEKKPGNRLAIPLAVIMGLLAASAAFLNGSVTVVMGNPIKAALLSFATGTVILLAINFGIGKHRKGMSHVVKAYSRGLLPWWFVMEGAVAAFGVTAQSQSVAVVGVALFTITAVSGQTISSIVVDRIGFGPSGVIPVTPLRVISAATILVAVSVSMSDKFHSVGDLWSIVLPLSLTFVAGLTMGFQQAMNGRTAAVAQSPMVSTLQNFFIGTVVLTLVVVVRHVSGPTEIHLPEQWWLYLSGPIAVAFVYLIGHLVKSLGVLVLAVCAIAGQVAGSVVLDLLFPRSGTMFSLATIVGAFLTLTAVILVGIAKRSSLRN